MLRAPGCHCDAERSLRPCDELLVHAGTAEVRPPDRSACVVDPKIRPEDVLAVDCEEPNRAAEIRDELRIHIAAVQVRSPDRGAAGCRKPKLKATLSTKERFPAVQISETGMLPCIRARLQSCRCVAS
jgi:hypothetical protein